MPSSHCLTTAGAMEVFTDELAAHAGVVTDTYQAGDRLIARSLLPFVQDVRPRDRLQGGVALKAVEGEVWVYPYVFRQVCSNGAIMSHTLDALHLDLSWEPSAEAQRLLREAIAACCEPAAFQESVERIRSTLSAPADLALNLLPMLSRLRDHGGEHLASEVMRRFLETQDRSQFGLMNAVTSVARDTSDPEVRWRLEELGGGIAVGEIPRIPHDNHSRRCTVAV